MNWYKTSQTFKTNSMIIHPLSNRAGRIFIADDDSEEHIHILVIPVVNDGKSYITIQLDASHGGLMPKSPQLNKLKDIIVESIKNIPQVKFIDDYFDPMEANLPSGAYKTSKMENVFGPLREEEIENNIYNMEKSWIDLADKLIQFELISSYEIKNLSMKTLSMKISDKERSNIESIIKKDSTQMQAFLCRLERFKNSQSGILLWIKNLESYVTDWTWGSIHGSKYEIQPINADDCKKTIDKTWAMRFGDGLMSPGREIFMYVCGYPLQNHESVMEIIKNMPAEAMSKNGVEQFIEYASDSESSIYLKQWIKSFSNNRSSFDKNILSHPWAAKSLEANHPELSEFLKNIQESSK